MPLLDRIRRIDPNSIGCLLPGGESYTDCCLTAVVLTWPLLGARPLPQAIPGVFDYAPTPHHPRAVPEGPRQHQLCTIPPSLSPGIVTTESV